MTDGQLEAASGRGALRVQITCEKGNDLARLLDDTARFIRTQAGHIIDAADDDEDLELMFKRVDHGDFVIVSVKLR